MQEYINSKEASVYKLLAQKLSQHLENLAEDPNTRTRWIWQLIQNAKDVPNQFGKVKIRVEVGNSYFRFSHNGDPFKFPDLVSVVSQYSQKPSEDKENSDITGKYGTGFITTYILSRKLSIQGILKVTGKVKGQDDSVSEDISWSDEVSRDLPKEESQNGNMIGNKEPENENLMDMQESQNENVINNEESQESQNKGGRSTKQYFRNFKFKLNREYKDRDEDLIKKLMKNEKKIMQELNALKKKEMWTRKEDDFDTSFTYEKLDKAAYGIVQKGINTLSTMFPYALLFNQKLFSIQVLDKRTKRMFQDFSIQKKQSFLVNQELRIAHCQIVTNSQVKNHYLAYNYNTEENSTVAVPVQYHGKRIHLLVVPEEMPKIFKEFPLIGAKDTGFNYVFTSRKFYPNETRSNLMLKYIQGRKTERAQINWRVLQTIFGQAKDLFKQLSIYITDSQENFLKVSQRNLLGNQEDFFKKNYADFRKTISELNIVQFSDGTSGSIHKLNYLYEWNSENMGIQELSGKVNEVFKFLFPPSTVLSLKKHQMIYTSLFGWHWDATANCYNLEKCLRQISDLGFMGLVSHLDSREKAYNKLEEMYKFLAQFMPSFTTFKKSSLFTEGPKIILTNKMQLKSIATSNTNKLMFKKDLPKVYEHLCKILEIDIEDNMVHDSLAHYMKQLQPFTFAEAMDLVANYFESTLRIVNKSQNFNENPYFRQDRSMFGTYPSVQIQPHVQIDQKKFKLLIQFMKTFNIGKNVVDLCCCWEEFSTLGPLNLSSVKHLRPLQKEQIVEYCRCLQNLLLYKLQQQLKSIKTIHELSSRLNFVCLEETQLSIKKEQRTKNSINWFNSVLNLQTGKEQPKNKQERPKIKHEQLKIKQELPKNKHQDDREIVTKNLSWSLIFIDNDKIKAINEYPNQAHLQFYQLMKSIWNNKNMCSQLIPLQQQLVHPRITYLKNNSLTNYSTLFKFTCSLIGHLSNIEKMNYLTYLEQLRLKHKENPSKASLQEFQTHESVYKQRHSIFINLNQFSNQEADIVYDIITKQRRNLPKLYQLLSTYTVQKNEILMDDLAADKEFKARQQ